METTTTAKEQELLDKLAERGAIIFIGANQLTDMDLLNAADVAIKKSAAAIDRKVTICALSQNTYMSFLQQYEFGQLSPEEQQRLLNEQKKEERIKKEDTVLQKIFDMLIESHTKTFTLHDLKNWFQKTNKGTGNANFSNKEVKAMVYGMLELGMIYREFPANPDHRQVFHLVINEDDQIEKLKSKISVIELEMKALSNTKKELQNSVKELVSEKRIKKSSFKKHKEDGLDQDTNDNRPNEPNGNAVRQSGD